MLTAAAALDLTARLVAVTVVLGALELLVGRRELRPGGMLDWSVSSLVPPVRRVDRALRTPALRTVLTARGTVVVAGLELVAGVLLAISPRTPGPALAALLCHAVLTRRHHQSVEGSDDMVMVLLLTLTLRSLTDAAVVQTAAAGFVAAQVALAYLTSGLSKTQGREWWDGTGLPRTLTTRYFGHPAVAALMWRHRPTALAASWATIGCETCFLFALLGPSWLVVVAVIALGGLHVACAAVMGLSQFVWCFLATYPCVVVTHTWVVAHLDPGARLVTALAVAVLVVGVGAFFAGRALTSPARFTAAPAAPRRLRVPRGVVPSHRAARSAGSASPGGGGGCPATAGRDLAPAARWRAGRTGPRRTARAAPR